MRPAEPPAGRLARAASLAAALAILVALRLPSNQVQILNVDEADFAVEAGALLDGGRPYLDFVEKKPPLVYLLYAAGLGLAGRWNLPGLRLLLLGWVLLSAAAAAAIARRLWGGRAALLAAPLYALAVSAGPPMDLHAANAETLFLLPLLLGAWLCLPQEGGGPASRGRLALAGALLALGSLVKQQAGMQLPIAGAFLLLGSPPLQASPPLRERLRDAALLCAGFAAVWLLALAAMGAAGILGEFWYWTVEINRYYIAHGNSWSDAAQILLGALPALAGFLPLLWLLALGELALQAAGRRPRQPLIWLWLAGSLVPIALGGRFFLHYFLQWLPAVALLAAAAGAALWGATAARRDPSAVRRRAAAALGAIAALLAIGLPLRARMAPFRDPELLSVPHAMPQARALAAAIRASTPAGARIVVWGYGTALHYLSQRQPATRFPYVTYLTGAVEGTPAWWSPFTPSRPLEIPRAWELFFADLERRPPELVVDTAPTGYFAFYKFPISKYPRLQRWLEAGYRREEIAGFPVWRRLPSRPDPQ